MLGSKWVSPSYLLECQICKNYETGYKMCSVIAVAQLCSVIAVAHQLCSVIVVAHQLCSVIVVAHQLCSVIAVAHQLCSVIAVARQEAVRVIRSNSVFISNLDRATARRCINVTSDLISLNIKKL